MLGYEGSQVEVEVALLLEGEGDLGLSEEGDGGAVVHLEEDVEDLRLPTIGRRLVRYRHTGGIGGGGGGGVTARGVKRYGCCTTAGWDERRVRGEAYLISKASTSGRPRKSS